MVNKGEESAHLYGQVVPRLGRRAGLPRNMTSIHEYPRQQNVAVAYSQNSGYPPCHLPVDNDIPPIISHENVLALNMPHAWKPTLAHREPSAGRTCNAPPRGTWGAVCSCLSAMASSIRFSVSKRTPYHPTDHLFHRPKKTKLFSSRLPTTLPR